MNLAQLLVRTAQIHPDAPALVHGNEQLCNYRELASRAARIGGFLGDALGLRPGERVALLLHNVPEYLEVLYGVWFAGLVAVPINAKLHAREVEFILHDAGAAALFASADLKAGLDAIDATPARAVFVPGTAEYAALVDHAPMAQPLPRAPDDHAWRFYTSGTTGRPKGVMQSHRNLLAMTMCYFTDVDNAQQQDAIVYAAPMSHGAGLYNFAHVLVGARHVIPLSGGFDPAELLARSSIGRCRCSPRRPWSGAWSSISRRSAPIHPASRPSCTAAARCMRKTSAMRSR